MKIMSSSSLAMKPPNTIINQILEIVALAPGCHLKYVAQLLPDLTLREVIHALWYLNRMGQLDLKMDKHEGLTLTPSRRLFH
jgi:hypothetical protein